jgi:hypothetical protein
VLVPGDVLPADREHPVERGPQADGVGDVAGAGLVPERRGLVDRSLEGHVGDRVATALPGGRELEDVRALTEAGASLRSICARIPAELVRRSGYSLDKALALKRQLDQLIAQLQSLGDAGEIE